MPTSPKELLKNCPVRKTKAQRRSFWDAVQAYAECLGYETCLRSDALILGNGKQARYLFTADNCDSALLVLLEVLRSLPENRRDRIAVVFSEKTHFPLPLRRKRSCEAEPSLFFHLKEVGKGDKLRFFPAKQLLADRRKLTSLYKACGYFGRKSLLVQETTALPWYIAHPNEVHICAVEGKKETYSSRIRENREPLDETNINILRAGLVSFITCTD